MDFALDTFRWLTDPANHSGPNGIPVRLWEHVQVSFLALFLATLLALPIGLLIGHTGRGEFFAVSVANIGRALPSFGILGIVFPLTLGVLPGFGYYPTLIALFLLAIPPILTNAYVGVQNVDRETVEAARGMGMSGRQVLAKLEVPLAAPLIVAGLRTSAVAVVATATLGAVAAGPGLGRFIIDGFVTRNLAKAAGGAVLVAVRAILTELAFGLLERSLTPRTSSQGRRRTPRAGGIATPETA
ncbi:ABC transporter permease subunit [soil metagenome]